MRRLIVFLVGLAALPCLAQTLRYVDPLYTGGGNNGTSTNPWNSLSDSGAWTSLNTSLASGAVTVYFSACDTTCSAAETSSTAINLSSRTDTSTNVLTLDGVSQHQTNSSHGTAGGATWAATGVTLAPCTGYRCAATASFMTAKRFQLTGTTPINGGSSFSSCVNYFTVQGFEFANNEGQSGNLTYVGNITIQYNEFHRTAAGTFGPGLIVGPAQHGPCHTGAARPSGTDSGPDNVTVQYNYIHETWGECIYVGASSSDPFIAAVQNNSQQFEAGVNGDNLSCGNGCNSNSTQCTVPGTPASCSTGANYLIQDNTVESCAAWGAQGDGIDVKDGHTNLQVIGNTMRTTLFPACAGTCGNLVCWGGTAPPNTSCTNDTPCTGGGHCGAGSDGQSMLYESGSVAAGNYMEAPGHQCMPVYASWNTSIGRGDMEIYNNLCVNANSGAGTNAGVSIVVPNVSGEASWSTAEIYNNSFYSINGAAINNDASSGVTVTAKNNVLLTFVSAITGTVTKDYNDYTGNTETHGITGNPLFVSTTPPYNAANFQLQATSPAKAVGLNLTSLGITALDVDYFGSPRSGSAAWTMGFFEFPPSTTPPPARPPALVAVFPKQINLSWPASATPGVEYNVYRSTGGAYSKIASGDTHLYYLDKAVTRGTTYWYAVTAFFASGCTVNCESAASPIVTLKCCP